MNRETGSSIVPRVYCDFNDRIDRSTYGLRTLATIADLEGQGIHLVEGLNLTLYDFAGDDDGNPAWIVANAVIVYEPGIGLVARVHDDAFRWESRATHRARVHWSAEHVRRGLPAGYCTTDPAWLPADPGNGWSLACTFSSPPAAQGSPSTADVTFVMPAAPHDQLRPGATLKLFERATRAFATVEILD